jgi:uroporphyrin-III C-methyltransferase
VGAGPGAADLITLRGLRALRAAEYVLYDHLVDSELLDEARGSLVYVGKRCGQHFMTQPDINRLLVDLASSGYRVVRLKGGDSCVFGRVGEEASALADAGLPFDWVPGVSSAVAAAELAAIPVTHRGVAEGFTVVTAHRRTGAADYAAPPYDARRTLVLLMGVRTRETWRDELLALGYPPDLPVAFIEQAGDPQQRVVETTLARLVEDTPGLRSPAVAVLGQVVRLRAALAPYLVAARALDATQRSRARG